MTATTPTPPRDEYDEAVEFLTNHPTLIGAAWNHPHTEKGGCLFVATNLHGAPPEWSPKYCGCLTQIRQWPESFSAPTPQLWEEIRNDKRIPDRDHIKPPDLPIFAEWQRRLDRELGRKGGRA